MKKKWKTITATALAVVLVASIAYASDNKSPLFTTRPASSAQGYWSDKENLTWTWWGESDGYTTEDGESVLIGNGPRYSDLHPEVTDLEYLLKEYVNYPGDGLTNLNQWGEPKANFEVETLSLLQEFVNSFDWIHANELTRLKAVYNRIACGQNGNTYGYKKADAGAILRYKNGNCQNYAEEFQRLAKTVGLECVVYEPYYNHVSNMVKINGQWITVDPTVNAVGNGGLFLNTETIPVDYETELKRYPEEQKQKDDYVQEQNQIKKVEELRDQYFRDEISYDELQQKIAEIY